MGHGDRPPVEGPLTDTRGWPSADGWEGRAAAGGARGLDRSPVLTASEIGAFAFCPQAWYLQRRRVPATPEAAARRRAGERAHRVIGRQTDALRAAHVAQRLLLVAIAALAAAVLLLGLRGLA
jgi:hypothetical protein